MRKREKFCVWLFDKTKTPYANLKNRAPWGISRAELLAYPQNSLGNRLGVFLKENNFHPIPKLENHDLFHVLTGYGTEVEDEIALQYFFLGNGKRSAYLIGVIILGILLFPETYRYFIKAYNKGANANKFYHWKFKIHLHIPIESIKNSIHNVNPRHKISSKYNYSFTQ